MCNYSTFPLHLGGGARLRSTAMVASAFVQPLPHLGSQCLITLSKYSGFSMFCNVNLAQGWFGFLLSNFIQANIHNQKRFCWPSTRGSRDGNQAGNNTSELVVSFQFSRVGTLKNWCDLVYDISKIFCSVHFFFGLK